MRIERRGPTRAHLIPVDVCRWSQLDSDRRTHSTADTCGTRGRAVHGMRIERLHVRNFRCFDDLELTLNAGVTLLVGENNVGKSAVLDAIALVLGFRREGGTIQESDFQSGAAGADIRSAPAVRIDVVIVPRTGTTFRPGALGNLIPSLDPQLRETVRLSMTAVYDHDPAVRDVITRLQRVDPDGTNPQEEYPRFPLRDRLPARVYAVARDFEQGTGSRASDWHKLIGEARPDPHVLEAVSKRLKSAGAYLVRETPSLSELATGLTPALAASGLLPGARVSFAVAPSDPEELFRQLDLRIRSDGSPRDLPPTRHGLGAQNMVLFALYEMYASKVLRANDPGAPSPVLLVEEPESHLHPAAVRSLATRVKSLPGQVIATTHSPEFARAFEASDVTMLHRSGTVRRAARCSKEASRALKEHPNAIFAHCIVVVEGEGEECVVPVFADALGVDLHGRGVEILNAHGQERILELWRCFGPRGLDIPIVCVADADSDVPLRAFLRAAAGDPVPANFGALKKQLWKHNYFCCAKAGKALEHELATLDEPLTDAAFVAMGEDDFPTWRAQHAATKCKLHKREVRTLTDAEARICRVARSKYDAPRAIANALTTTANQPTLMPAHIRAALNAVVRMT